VYSASAEQARTRDSATGSRRLRLGPEPSYLTRLGIVYADPIRLIIVRELNMREMSPPEFVEEFGGGSVDKVRWHFKKLAAHGWLRKVKTAKSRVQEAGRRTFTVRRSLP
jgi:hypothetical protein